MVMQLLGIQDAFSMGQSCTRFHALLRNNGVCRTLLANHARFSREYKAACVQNTSYTYTRALQSIFKSRSAVTSLRPFIAAVVACEVDAHVYTNRTLLYMSGRDLRILDLGRSVTVRHEMVIDVPAMLAACLLESKGCVRYKFRPVHYAAGYLTCLYTHQRARAAREQWLIVLDPATGWNTQHPLTVPQNKLFVRNNAEYLVFGTLTGRPDDNETLFRADGDAGDYGSSSSYAGRYWVIRRFSFRTRTWATQSIIYLDAIGCSDFGNDVVFELLDDDGGDDGKESSGGTLYALSLRTRLATWSRRHAANPESYYCCVRVPLRHPARYQQATRASRWRRRIDEGAMDDRFCSVVVERNEVTGAVMVVEERKEWRKSDDFCGSRRTRYKQELNFPEKEEVDSEAMDVDMEHSGRSGDGEEAEGMISITAEDDEDEDADDYNERYDRYERGEYDGHGHTRAPENVHPGDSTAEIAMFSYSNTAARAYITPCATYLDMVNLPDPEMPNIPRMVLRARSRQPRHPSAIESGSLDGEGGRVVGVGCGALVNANDNGIDDPLYPLGEIKRRYETSEVVTWPPDVDARECGDGRRKSGYEDCTALHELLNPPGYEGYIGAKWDDYTLVYATGGDGDNTSSRPGLVGQPKSTKTTKKKQAIVLVSFDPTLCLPGLPRWKDRTAQKTTAETCDSPAAEAMCVEATQHGRPSGPEPLLPSWVSYAEPTYQMQPRGFDFFY